jgi:hypothetical protein
MTWPDHRSFARIAPRSEFTARVYDRLFANHPELRPLFRTEMAAQPASCRRWSRSSTACRRPSA